MSVLTPRCSIVVPTFHRMELLERCLESLKAQKASGETYEVIVVDDANDSSTRLLVASHDSNRDNLSGLSEIRYIAVEGERHGPSVARNMGWRAAKGEIILFTDDDTQPDEGWVSSVVEAVDSGADALWGRIIVPLSDSPTDFERDTAGLENAGFVTANCACRRHLLEQVDGFDERFTTAWREDSDLFFRLLDTGRDVRYVQDAKVVHPVRPAGWGISVRQQRKSMFDALLWKKHRNRFRKYIVPQRPYRYYAILSALIAAVASVMVGARKRAGFAAMVWLGLTLNFAMRRLRGASRRVSHVLEMIVTSAVIPPLSIGWRLYGALRFRTLFW